VHRVLIVGEPIKGDESMQPSYRLVSQSDVYEVAVQWSSRLPFSSPRPLNPDRSVRFLWDAHGYQLTHGVVRHHDLAKLFLAKIKDLNLVTDNATHKGEIVSVSACGPSSSALVCSHHLTVRIQMSTKNSAVTGFRKMSIHDLSGLPVLGDNGVLAGTLSESDLRGITQETFKHALLPVMDFLARVQR
jgi:CBS domain-containing protein